MNEKEQLEKILSEYDTVAAHYKEYSIASRGAIRSGEQRAHIYDRSYSDTIEKGVPILAFIIDDSAPVNPENVEIEHRKELSAFKKTVKTGRLVERWKTSDELAQKVTVALHNQMSRTERPGWVRGTMS